MLYIVLVTFLGLISNSSTCKMNEKNIIMLSYSECLNLAKEKLKISAKEHSQYVIWEEKTITKEFGYVFIPSTLQFIETGKRNSLVPGISPIIVNKRNEDCFMIASSRPMIYWIKKYEEELKSKD